MDETGGSPDRDTYDAIVVGSGIGGLTTGALLARAGMKVLIAEQGDAPGGCAHAFRRGPYTFDPAVHYTNQGGPGELYDVVLRFLGVRELCTLERVNTGYHASFPSMQIQAPPGCEAHVEAHVRKFPHEAEGIRRFFSLCTQMQYEIHRVPMYVSLRDLDAVATKYPTLFKYRTASLNAALDDCLTDPRAKAACAASWPYGGSPPSRQGFLVFSQTWWQFVESMYYCRGSFQTLADALSAAVELHGGTLLLKNGVRRILIDNGKVCGVELEDGSQVQASVVISNADARHTVFDLIGADHLPAAYRQRLKRLQPSLSAFVVFAATSLDLRERARCHEIFLHRTWDHEEAFQGILSGLPGAMWITLPSAMDPSLAPPGENIAIITSLAAYDIGLPWERKRERFAEQLLTYADEVLPGLREGLTFMESATPVTIQNFTRNYQGAAYGWENTAAQTGSRRPGHQTPIGGLYLVGHWSLPGAGTVRVFTSGIHTALIVLKETRWDGPRPDLSGADFPSIT